MENELDGMRLFKKKNREQYEAGRTSRAQHKEDLQIKKNLLIDTYPQTYEQEYKNAGMHTYTNSEVYPDAEIDPYAYTDPEIYANPDDMEEGEEAGAVPVLAQRLKTYLKQSYVQTQVIIALIIVLFAFVCNMINDPRAKGVSAQISNTVKTSIDIYAIFPDLPKEISIKSIFHIPDNILNPQDGQTANDTQGSYKIDESSISEGEDTDGLLARGDHIDSTGGQTVDDSQNDSLPVSGTVSAGFGERINPITKKQENHQGLDISANEGTVIKAYNTGTVENVAWSDTYGNNFFIRGNDGVTTFYAHCLDIFVSNGDVVESGNIVATVGNTGSLSTGPHLHFELIKDGVKIDPLAQ